MGSTLHIHDPGGAVEDAWCSGDLDAELSAVPPDQTQCVWSGTFAARTLHEGYLKGVVDSVSTGNWINDGWYDPQTQQGEPCTFLRVGNGPFEAWMHSHKTLHAGNYLKVNLVGPSGQTLSAPVTVLGVNDPCPYGKCRLARVEGQSTPETRCSARPLGDVSDEFEP